MLLYRVMRVEVDSRSFNEAERSCTRLDHQFRDDVHEATSVNIKHAKPTEGEFLLLQLPEDRTIAYTRSNGSIGRVMSREGKMLARDEFSFPSSSSVEMREEESPKRLVLSITSPGLDETNNKAKQLQNLKAVPVGLLIEACTSRSTQVAGSSSKPESAK
jgi:hypothetical protein